MDWRCLRYGLSPAFERHSTRPENMLLTLVPVDGAGENPLHAGNGYERHPMRSWRTIAKAILIPLLLCAHWAPVPKAPLQRPLLAGIASYYGSRHQGRRMANGRRFDKEKLTAAAPDWPFGTRCRVISLLTRRSVIVEITDRGPFVAGRVIDLSEAAARAIGMVRAGTAQVAIERLPSAR